MAKQPSWICLFLKPINSYGILINQYVYTYFGPRSLLIPVKTRYTDTHILSREREISIKSAPMSLVLSTTSGKSHIIHFIDTPGHINFVDEVASAVRLVDGILLVVDAVEGVCFCTIENLPTYDFTLAHGRNRICPPACFARRRRNHSGCKQNRQVNIGIAFTPNRCLL